MDPLGQRSEIVDADTLTKWNLTQLPEYKEKTFWDNPQVSPFPWRNDLNSKIALWDGDPLLLNVHAIVNPTNEAMNDETGLSGRVYTKAGPGLIQDIRNNIKGCKTGEARITEGYNLPSRYVIHTVGPRHHVKYTTAAESALYSCYRNVLQLARDHNIKTLALTCIHSLSRGYPPEDGAHLALRTVRRFLEKYNDSFTLVIFVVSEQTNKDIYQELLPLYFPRSQDESERALRHLPPDIGNDEGEPIIPERKIRIVDNPTFASLPDEFDQSIDLNRDYCASSCDVGHHPFAQMMGDVDKVKRGSLSDRSPQQLLQIEKQKRYQYLLQRACTTDLSDIAVLRCLYQSGVDRMGRPVVIFIGRNLPTSDVDLEKVILYFIQVMDPVVIKEYVIVYFHTLTRPSNRPDVRFLKTMYDMVDDRYKKNLKSFYVVHPTIWSKVATWFITTFNTTGIKQKVHNLAGIEHLYSRINPDQLVIPAFITDYDTNVNGRRYYIPSEREVKEAMEGL